MGPKLYAMNVGRGDCFFLEIPTDDGHAIVMIDGGDTFPNENAAPVRFLERMGWERIDLLILTHLHHDHIVGLLSVAERIKIETAILPYPLHPIIPPTNVGKASKVAELFGLYENLWALLQRQHASIVLRPPFGEQSVWQYGEIRLRHLDPLREEQLHAYHVLKMLASDGQLSDLDKEHLHAKFDQLSNGDCSVWLVKHGEQREQWMLFGGDAPLPNWEAILQREMLQPRGFKVPHHGLKDSVNDWLLDRLSPDWILITNDAEESKLFREDWNKLSSNAACSLFITGESDFMEYLVCELPHHPQVKSRS